MSKLRATFYIHCNAFIYFLSDIQNAADGCRSGRFRKKYSYMIIYSLTFDHIPLIVN